MSLDKDFLEEILTYMLNNDLLAYVFKDLIWGIIQYKEENWEDSSERIRGFIEHSHKALYETLINLTSNPIHLKYYEKSAKKIYNKLRWYIFWDLSINETTLLDETRQIYEDLASHFHVIISDGSKSDFLLIIVTCIKLMLLVEEIVYIIEKNQKNKLKSIDIIKKQVILFTLKNNEILETFLNIVFSPKIRDLIFQKSILDLNDISNSRFLQRYLPYYIFNYCRIENLLFEKAPHPFRSTGPQLIDYEKGNWIFIPKIAKYMFKHLRKHKKSILISATSGTGKTVISRWIGYKFYSKGYNVFYIDCLEHKTKKLESVLDQIIIHHESGVKKSLDTLFIFENIHKMDDDLKSKLNQCKDSTLCLLTERIFEEKEKEKKTMSQYFDSLQIFKISMNHWTFRNTIKGILNLNSRNPLITRQLQYIGNQNLWIYTILLKLFKESLEIKPDSSIIDILINHKLIGEKISEYFNNLLKVKIIKFKSSEDTQYLNHIHYFLGILSIFSQYELWTESKFLDYIITIKDESALGKLNSDINIDKDILNNIQAFLIDIFEISERSVDFRPGIKEKEYKIPHSQMAIIYKNCILKLYDNIYPGLIDQVMFHYISFGKYYGSYLQQKYLYLIKEGNFKDFREINKRFFDFKSYLNSINYDTNFEIFQNQFIKNTIEENDIFLYCVRLSSKELGIEILKKIFHKKLILFNQIWKFKISESKPYRLFYFLDKIYNILEKNVFIEFFRNFKEEIIEKLKENRGEYIFSFLNLFLPFIGDPRFEFIDSISQLIDDISIEIKDLFSIYIRNESFFNSLVKDHIFYSKIKKAIKDLILKINFEEEQQFVPSPYYNYNKLFTQIYLEIIEELLDQSSQDSNTLRKSYEKKLSQTNLISIINYLKHLYEFNNRITMRFFKKFLDLIKEKLYNADVDNIETFFDLLSNFFKEEKEFIKNAFLSDWDWFIGIFLRLSNSEFFYFSKFRIINGFFEDLFPEYIEKYNKFFIHESKLRIQEYYENLECKLDIVDRLTIILGDELNEFILNLFNKSIYDSLKTQSLSFYIKTFSKLKLSYSLKENWDCKLFLLSNDFKEKLMQAKGTELKEFFNIFWKSEPWREILFDHYKELLINRFGQNYEIIMKLDEGSQEFIDHLKAIVNDFNVVEIIKHYNNYSDPFFGKKESYFFLKLREIIQENYDKFFNAEFRSKLSSLDFTDIFNLLIILKVYHLSILKEFCIRNRLIILDNLTESNEILEVITILEFYKLKLNFLKELDELLAGDISLYDVVLEALKKIDLASLRYLIQINPAGFLNKFIKVNLSNHLEHSSLLQLSIFLYKVELNVALKIPGHMYIRKMSFNRGPVQKYPFVLELSEEDLEESLLWLELRFRNPEKEGISYSHHSVLITKILSEQFIPFSPKIIDLIKQSKVWEIALYFKSLTKIFTGIEQNRFEIPEKLEKYLISVEFKKKINNAEFYDIYRLFKYLKIINFSLSREIWIRNRNILEDEAFLHKLRNDYTYRIFKFYDMFNDEHFKFSLESIDVLKKIMRLRPLETIISYFLEILSNDDFNALISVFKEKIINIAKKYSKFELKKILREGFMRKYNTDSLKMMRTIFQERLNEKYFFES